MEMHIYRSLETRFGLRTLAVESAGTLIISLEKLSEEDNDIAVFSKIFKNEIGEDFISVHVRTNLMLSTTVLILL